MGDIIMLIGLGICVFCAVRTLKNNKKKGGCCGNCAKCGGCQRI